MKKRSLLTSVVASSVVASVLVLSGCGGSHASAPKTLPTLDKSDPKASGSDKIVADSNGNLDATIDLISDNKKVQVAQVTFTKVLKDGGEPACTQASDNCEVEAKQISACGIDASSDAFVEAKSHVLDLINEAGDRYDNNESMIVFGGTLGLSCNGFDDADMAIAINMIKCGTAFKADGGGVQSGFSNENIVVDVYVEEEGKDGRWLQAQVKDGKILLTREQLDTITLPVKFTFYTIYPREAKDGTTGITGSTGSGGYGG
jgi:hypothetical protein